jgi:hypothetical protein
MRLVEELADQIAAAERRVAEAREIVADQRASIQQLNGVDGNLQDAERRFRIFQSNLVVFEQHLEWLKNQQRGSALLLPPLSV